MQPKSWPLPSARYFAVDTKNGSSPKKTNPGRNAGGNHMRIIAASDVRCDQCKDTRTQRNSAVRSHPSLPDHLHAAAIQLPPKIDPINACTAMNGCCLKYIQSPIATSTRSITLTVHALQANECSIISKTIKV